MKSTTDLTQVQNCLNDPQAVLIYPTEAVFGIGCKANNFKAIQYIQKIKQRSPKKAFVVLAGNEQQLDYLINPNLAPELKYLVMTANSLDYLDLNQFLPCLTENELTLFNHLQSLLSHPNYAQLIDDNCDNYSADNFTNLAQLVYASISVNAKLATINAVNLKQIILSLSLKLLTFYHPKTINITFVLPANPYIDIPVELLGLEQTASLEEKQHATVAIRYTHASELVSITNLTDNIPLVSTSCNISGKDPLISSEQVINEFGDCTLTDHIYLFDKPITTKLDPCIKKIAVEHNFLRESNPQYTSIIIDFAQLKVLRNGNFLQLQNGLKDINLQAFNLAQTLLSLITYLNIDLKLK